MDVNTITPDGSAGPQPSIAPRRGDGSFQLAYACMLGENHTPVTVDRASANAPLVPNSSSPAMSTTHTVRAGETLYGIVRSRLATMGVDGNGKAAMQGVQQLAQANHIRNPDRIYIGQKLDVAALESMYSPTALAVPAADHSASAATIEQRRPWQWEEEPTPDAGTQLEDTALTASPLTAPAQLPA